MKKRHDILFVAGQWIMKADNDLRNAEHTLLMPDDCPYDTICYHAQQCVEKCIKAMLVSYAKDVPKIHDIGELVRLLPDKTVVPLSISEQETLSDYAVTSRYPGDWEPYTRDDATHACAMARKVREMIRNVLAL